MTDVLEKYNKMNELIDLYNAAEVYLEQAQNIADEFGFAFHVHPYGTYRGDLTVAQAQSYVESGDVKHFGYETQDLIQEVISEESDHHQDDDDGCWRSSFC